jgi:hypothetical protein
MFAFVFVDLAPLFSKQFQKDGLRFLSRKLSHADRRLMSGFFPEICYFISGINNSSFCQPLVVNYCGKAKSLITFSHSLSQIEDKSGRLFVRIDRD